MNRRIATRGILVLGLSAAVMAIAASPAAATRSLKPDSLSFRDQLVGTKSAPKSTVLTVSCNEKDKGSCIGVDNFAPSITTSGDFAQTSNCPPLIVGNTPPGSPVRCTINVTFTPTGTGQRTGVLSTGPGGPTAFLTGKGVGLKLDLTANKQELKKKIKFFAAANGDSVLIAKGDVKRKTKQLAVGEKTKVKAKLKKKVFKRLKKRLNQGKKAKAVVKGKATTSSGLVAKDKVKVKFTK